MPTDLVRPRGSSRPGRRPSRLRLAIGAVLCAPILLVMLVAWAVLVATFVLFSLLAARVEG